MALADHDTPAVGQVWWDKDHRVISQHCRIIEVRDDGYVVIARGHVYPRKSRVRIDRLLKHFTLTERP